MKNFYKLMIAVGMLFTAAGFLSAQNYYEPVVSSADNSNENWYYLKCYRDGRVISNATGNGVVWNSNNPSDYRKFKVVKDPVNNTYGIVYKDALGSYLYLQQGVSDIDAAPSFTTTAFTGFTFTPSSTTLAVVAGSGAKLQVLRIYRSATGFLHMKATFGFRWYNALEDNSLFLFFNEKIMLQEKISLATKTLSTSEVGTGNGQYSEASRTTLNDAIVTAQDKVDNNTAMFVDAETLHTAITTYLAGVISSNKLAQAVNYRIHTNNGVIAVDGVDKFDVYSLMGQKINAKANLKAGVYFVKMNGSTQKVIVK